jgi:hypothetical protein
MSIRRFISSITDAYNVKRNEQIEKFKDQYYDHYYTDCAKNHLNKILETYNRKTQHSFDKSLKSVKRIGLYEPCADNIKYLKNMRWISTKPIKR